MKDNSYSRNSAVEAKGISYLQLINDNSASKEDRILNKDIQYLKPALNMKTVTRLTKADGNYFNLTNLNTLKCETTDNFNRLHISAQSSHLSNSSVNNELFNVKVIPNIPSKTGDFKGTKQFINTSNNSFSNNNVPIHKENNVYSGEDNNEILNYTEEFKNYQNLFNKMKSEISNLNKKLSEIDKSSQQGSNFSMNSISSNLHPIKKDNNNRDSFASDKMTSNYKLDVFSNMNACNPQNIKDVSFEENKNTIMNASLNKNYLDTKLQLNKSHDKETIPIETKKHSINYSSFAHNSSQNENKKVVKENEFIDRNEKYNRARSQSQNIRIDEYLQLSPKKSRIPIDSKKNSILPNKNTKKTNSIQKSNFDYKKENMDLEKQNKDILSEIELIEGLLRNQYGFTNLDNYEENQTAKSHLRMELEVYKNRVENVGEKYLETIRNLNSSVKNDKEQFVKNIKDISQLTNKSVNDIKNKYTPILTKYEININKLKKDNESIKTKLNNMKRILSDF